VLPRLLPSPCPARRPVPVLGDGPGGGGRDGPGGGDASLSDLHGGRDGVGSLLSKRPPLPPPAPAVGSAARGERRKEGRARRAARRPLERAGSARRREREKNAAPRRSRAGAAVARFASPHSAALHHSLPRALQVLDAARCRSRSPTTACPLYRSGGHGGRERRRKQQRPDQSPQPVRGSVRTHSNAGGWRIGGLSRRGVGFVILNMVVMLGNYHICEAGPTREQIQLESTSSKVGLGRMDEVCKN
jgi:hypothetical protein